MDSVTVKLAILLVESVTVAVNDAVVVPSGGVPVKKPVGARMNQDGKPVALHVNGPVPPDTRKLPVYSSSSVAVGKTSSFPDRMDPTPIGARKEIVSCAFTARTKLFWVCDSLTGSVRVTTNEIGPAVADSPVNTPLWLRANPCGRPDALQLYSEKSPLPPAAMNLKLYGTPTVAAGIAGGVTIVSADSTTNVKSLLLVLSALSVTVSAKV
jgi:hypothetical protein